MNAPIAKSAESQDLREPYVRPVIESADGFERFALNCTGMMSGIGNFSCGAVKVGMAGSCTDGCVGS